MVLGDLQEKEENTIPFCSSKCGVKRLTIRCSFASKLANCQVHIDHSKYIFLQNWIPRTELVEIANGHISQLNILKRLNDSAYV